MDTAKFREILIWPVRVRGIKRQPSQAADTMRIDSRWRSVEPYNHVPGADPKTRYAEFVYFHPFVRHFLYSNQEQPPVQIIERDDVRAVRVQPPYSADTLTLGVDRLQLYFFETDIALLVVEIQADHIELPVAQNLLDGFRRAYPPYWESGKPGHSPMAVEWLDAGNRAILNPANYSDVESHCRFVAHYKQPPVAAHWRSLLEPMQPWGGKAERGVLYYEQLDDERIPAMYYMAFDNPYRLQDADFVRLALLEDAGPSSRMPYSREFLADFERRYCYDRFWSNSAAHSFTMNTRYLVCGYGFGMIGENSYADGSPLFFVDPITGALAHFRHHYFQLGVIALMQRASLLVLWDRLAEARLDKGRLQNIQRDLATFTSRFWFTEPSSQVQARELFQMWTGHLGTPELFEHVKTEIELASDVLNTQASLNLNRTAAGLGALALAFTFLGMNVLVPPSKNEFVGWLWLVGSIAAFCLLSLGVFWRLDRPPGK